ARNERLFAKYRRTRDPAWLAPAPAGRRRLRELVLAAVNVPSRLRRRPSLFVYEYNPTRAVARASAGADRRFGLVRAHPELADVAFAWSDMIRDVYFARRPPGTVVTVGNPKPRPAAVAPTSDGAVLVCGFTFSPNDLNCRRSDPERFTEEVLEGVRAARPQVR